MFKITKRIASFYILLIYITIKINNLKILRSTLDLDLRI